MALKLIDGEEQLIIHDPIMEQMGMETVSL
jgi:hypothetical protein